MANDLSLKVAAVLLEALRPAGREDVTWPQRPEVGDVPGESTTAIAHHREFVAKSGVVGLQLSNALRRLRQVYTPPSK